jgi:tRNA 2-thiouridine synthesizing protein E
MDVFSYKGKRYRVDAFGFLLDPEDWDEPFAEGMAQRCGVRGALTERHWKIIRYVRTMFLEKRKRPVIYQACKDCDVTVDELGALFPTGYWRGACKLAGLKHDEGYAPVPSGGRAGARAPTEEPSRVYRVDAFGFLADPAEWDEMFATCKAHEMKMPPLGERHWRVIYFLRGEQQLCGTVPTVFAACAALGMGLDEMERLFPDGYHRGAVKIAGLKAR